MGETTAVLVRHGRTYGQAENRYIGGTDAPLDGYGERQADILAEWAIAQSFTSLVCSSMARARATIAPVAAQTGLPVRIDDRLRELDFGIAEARTLEEVRAFNPTAVERFLADPVRDHFPSGEDPEQAVDRGLAAIEEAVSADPGGRILVVSHNTLIRLITCAVLGIPLRDYRARLPRIDPGARSALLFGPGDKTAMLSFNVPLPRSPLDPGAG